MGALSRARYLEQKQWEPEERLQGEELGEEGVLWMGPGQAERWGVEQLRLCVQVWCCQLVEGTGAPENAWASLTECRWGAWGRWSEGCSHMHFTGGWQSRIWGRAELGEVSLGCAISLREVC